MPNTPNHNLPFPDDDDNTDVPQYVQALAEATDTALTNLVPNSGVQTNLAVIGSTVDGWSETVAREHVIDGRVMFVRMQFTRTGAQLDASDAGNITDVTVGTITDASKRPAMDIPGVFRASLTSGACQISAAAGVIRIVDMHSTSRIEPGHTVDIYATYPLP